MQIRLFNPIQESDLHPTQHQPLQLRAIFLKPRRGIRRQPSIHPSFCFEARSESCTSLDSNGALAPSGDHRAPPRLPPFSKRCVGLPATVAGDSRRGSPRAFLEHHDKRDFSLGSPAPFGCFHLLCNSPSQLKNWKPVFVCFLWKNGDCVVFTSQLLLDILITKASFISLGRWT